VNDLETLSEKQAFVTQNYVRATAAAIALAVSANEFVISSLGSLGCAAIAVLASGMMSSSLSFQFFQFPNLISKSFGDDSSIILSLIDSFALFTSSYILSSIGSIASNTGLGSYGWSVAWLFLATCFVVGGRLTDAVLPSIYAN
jgi:hypothetical protein